jgi:protein-tyrosine phosphatase
MSKISVIFVCLGNICRSPLGEGIFRAKVEAAGLDDRFRIESAGTSAYHVGEPPDPGSVRVARTHGIDIAGQRSRQFVREDLETFDYVIAMDPSNSTNIQRLAEQSGTPLRGQLWLMRNFEVASDGSGDDVGVPDPWGGGAHGFDTVYDIVDRCCQNLLQHIRAEAL